MLQYNAQPRHGTGARLGAQGARGIQALGAQGALGVREGLGAPGREVGTSAGARQRHTQARGTARRAALALRQGIWGRDTAGGGGGGGGGGSRPRHD